MIKSPHQLLDEIKLGKIIKNLDSRELNSPEGAGFDLRVNSISTIEGLGSLRIDKRRTGTANLISSIENDGNACIHLKAGVTYLVTTIEEFELPEGLVGLFYPRSTLFRSGVVLQSSVLPFGYAGPMTFGLNVINPEGFEIQLGARFAHVIFMQVEGSVEGYRGQWQGGRIDQPNDEEQI
jgi:dUTP pyrophosphatase